MCFISFIIYPVWTELRGKGFKKLAVPVKLHQRKPGGRPRVKENTEGELGDETRMCRSEEVVETGNRSD
ncbi:Hypothetical protein SMAX5B_016618 [Scophthalmus maximus]|uniref:Uncharacterized protein n=1 Tax=Scophthalmus maximus TaxID=52904 RepID=A0A2U9BY65_SCOMX|nr:Hypothetical protein SMAX5B_016618 [Scophthalmus maximus]